MCLNMFVEIIQYSLLPSQKSTECPFLVDFLSLFQFQTHLFNNMYILIVQMSTKQTVMYTFFIKGGNSPLSMTVKSFSEKQLKSAMVLFEGFFLSNFPSQFQGLSIMRLRPVLVML